MNSCIKVNGSVEKKKQNILFLINIIRIKKLTEHFQGCAHVRFPY